MKIIRLALRSLTHFRAFSLINIIGLALSLMSVIVISRFIYHELTVDKFHNKIDRIFVTTQERQHAPGQVVLGAIPGNNASTTSFNFKMLEDPSVERFAAVNKRLDEKIEVDEQIFQAQALAVDSNFLYLFDFPLIRGTFDASRSDQALVSTDFAMKIWGKEDPIGKTFKTSSGSIITVGGLLEMNRVNSSFDFDIVLSNKQGYFFANEDSHQLFFLLYPNSAFSAFNEKYDNYIERGHAKYKYQLFPFEQLYLKNNYGSFSYFHNIFKSGNWSAIYILILVGVLILILGVVNYINIYTAVVLRRGKEFGMKKVFGAKGGSVFLQLYVENFTLIGFALLAASLLVGLANPLLEKFLGFPTSSVRGFDAVISLAILLVLPLITTLTPYLNFNYASPVKSIKNLNVVAGSLSLRKIFLAVQYILTLVMLILALYIIKHFRYMLNTDSGYDIENVVDVNLAGAKLLSDNKENLRLMWRKMEAFKGLIETSTVLESWTHGENPVNPYFKADHPFETPDGIIKAGSYILVTPAWLDFFDMELVQGRFWSSEMALYKQSFHELILTESAWDYYGFDNLEEATLQANQVIVGAYDGSRPLYKVVGVVKDFKVGHFSDNKSPLILHYLADFSALNFFVRIAPGKKQEGILALEEIYRQVFDDNFHYSFLTDQREELYRADKRVATIYSILTLVAILISAMGLFSMSLYDIQQRYKEIAVRKVSGATTGQLVILMLRRYLKLLALSYVIAVPLGWLAIYRYQQDFMSQASISLWVFLFPLLITAAVTILTLLQQTLKAARLNPSIVMRFE